LFSFNDLLLAGGVDPAGVMLLRHTGRNLPLLDIWRADRARVEAYQAHQRAGDFANATHVACLIPRPEGGEVFCGLYEVQGSTPVPLLSTDPLTGEPAQPGENLVNYDLRVVPQFESYVDRLVVAWFAAGKHPGWRQWAVKQPKRIIEIATQQERPFPGWLAFAAPVDEIDLLPRGWREVLRSTSGVYLLTDALGKHYVGSAKGGDGFLGRWQAYRDGRSGGNVGLVDAVGPFRVAVLQIFDPSTPDQTVETVESLWKAKLGAREAGYNRN
jgi:hypothetical protein